MHFDSILCPLGYMRLVRGRENCCVSHPQNLYTAQHDCNSDRVKVCNPRNISGGGHQTPTHLVPSPMHQGHPAWLNPLSTHRCQSNVFLLCPIVSGLACWPLRRPEVGNQYPFRGSHKKEPSSFVVGHDKRIHVLLYAEGTQNGY